MSFRHRPLMTSVYEWHCSHACTSTLVMGRMLDLPSVIELAPCKYKRVYFYFSVQKKLIFIYLFFFYFYFLGPIWLSFWGRFDLGPIWLEMVKNRLHILKDNFILYLMIAQCWPEAYLFIVGHWQFNPPSYLLIAYNSITPTNFTIYIIKGERFI